MAHSESTRHLQLVPFLLGLKKGKKRERILRFQASHQHSRPFMISLACTPQQLSTWPSPSPSEYSPSPAPHTAIRKKSVSAPASVQTEHRVPKSTGAKLLPPVLLGQSSGVRGSFGWGRDGRPQKDRGQKRRTGSRSPATLCRQLGEFLIIQEAQG